MKEIPVKLEKYLAKLKVDKKEEKLNLFKIYYKKADEHHIQSPRFWAMRQILAERNEEEIKRRLLKNIRKIKRTTHEPH